MSICCPPRIKTMHALRPSSGIGEDADKWEALENIYRENMSSAISNNGNQLEQDLFLLFIQHSTANWDGYGAKPVSPESFNAAVNFMRILPTTIPTPEFGVDPDGSIVFEWYRGPHKVFSIAVDRDNFLTFAGLFDSGKISGSEYFDQELSETIFLQIQRVFS